MGVEIYIIFHLVKNIFLIQYILWFHSIPIMNCQEHLKSLNTLYDSFIGEVKANRDKLPQNREYSK